jgi:hypothetical protein
MDFNHQKIHYHNHIHLLHLQMVFEVIKINFENQFLDHQQSCQSCY